LRYYNPFFYPFLQPFFYFYTKNNFINQNMKRVVITGLGALTPIGNTVADYWQNLLAGVSGAAPITKFDTSRFKTQFACEVKNVDILALLDKKTLQRTDPVIQYAMIAADQAVADAGIKDLPNKERIGTFWSTGIGGIQSIYAEAAQFAKGDGTPRFNPLLVPKMIVDGAAGQLSIRYGFKGATAAVVTACASSSHGLAFALDYIRMGRADVMLVGGSEAAITEVGVGAFSSLQAMSKRNGEPTRASRPFDKDRDGFVIGEGAGAIILESYEHAIARGAKIYAEFVGAGLTGDAYHITAPAPNGEGATRGMKLALQDAQINPSDIDYINTHSTSTPLGDESEPVAILNAFGEAAFQLNISGTKSMTGHLLGAAGAIEAIATILAVQNDIIPPTINLDNIDPIIDPRLQLTPHVAVKRTVKYGMSNNFGFGGHNASVIFKKYNP
jgi:3-oxoacyl-[acyl-carrier-protein] synthase II